MDPNRKSSETEDKAEKNKKKHKIKHLKLKIALLAIAGCAVCGYIALYPQYRDIKEKEFETFSKISDGAFHKAGNTVVLDRNGKKLASIGNEKYYYVKINKISPYVTKGYVSKEDKSFYTHHGVSWKGTFRATLKLIANRGRKTQGGSTITQQVVKNCLLTQTKTYKRKILEILAARQVEKQYTKAQIMEFYCNSNYYGNGCYGIEGASIYYFGKHASDLSLGEAAMLVGVSNLPNVYNPVTNYSAAMSQKKIVLSEMLEDGEITKEQEKEAENEKPEIVKKSANRQTSGYMTTYALHCATLKLMKHDLFQFRYKFSSQKDYKAYTKAYKKAYAKGYEKIRTGGYTIKTSLDPAIQKKLQSSIDKGLKNKTEKNKSGKYVFQGSGVCIDNRTQMVVAAVGGRSGSGEYNRAYQAERQPGSSIKPLLDYGPAMNEGVVYNGSLINDKKTTIGGFTPKNADRKYHGTVTAREALLHSYNIPALKVYSDTGRANALKYLQAMKFGSLTYTDQRVYPVSIGGFTRGATVADMAKGYSVLADGGQYTDSDCIMEIRNFADGKVYEKSNKKKQIYFDDVSFMLTDILEGTFKDKSGIGYGKSTGGQIYAAKTGTTNDKKDMWLCGYSKYYTTSLWLGYDFPRAINDNSKIRADIWLDFMNSIHNGLTPQQFEAPSTVKLRNGSGQEQSVSSSSYEARPEGWDYMSSSVEKLMLQNEEKRAEKYRIAQAAKAVKEFEEYQITDGETAQKYQQVYEAAYEKASAVSTSSKRQEFQARLLHRYNILKSAAKAWTDTDEEYNADVQAQKDEEAKQQASEATQAADEKLQKVREDTVSFYIKTLNAKTEYSSDIEDLISKAESALEKCKEYSDYSSLKSQLDEASKHARSLKNASTSQSQNTQSGETGTPSTDTQSSGSATQGTDQNASSETDTDTDVDTAV